MSQLFDLLFSTALRGVPLLAVALASVLVMRRASAASRHAVLALAIVAHLALPAVIALGPELRVPAEPARTAAIDLAAPALHLDAPWLALTDEVGAAGVARDSASTERGSARVLGLVWLAGTLLLVARWVAGLVGVARRRARGAPAEIGELESIVPRDCGVLYADVTVPCACGLLRSAILLPRDADGWSAHRLRVVLLHEAAHVRRRDVAIQGAAQLLSALFWFNPLVWLTRSRMQIEAELAADDAVLRAGTDAPAYVLELVSIVRSARGNRARLAAVGLGSDLTTRARRALRAGVERDAVGPRRAAGIALASAMVTLLAGATFARSVAPGPDLVTGCAWNEGRRHVNRWTDADGVTRWEVEWHGEDCSVRFVARPAALLVDGALIPATGRASISVSIQRGSALDTLVMTREQDRVSIASSDRAKTDPAWLRGLAHEIALHTAFDARQRVAAILARGGVDDVIHLASRAQGDHAAGVFLSQLVRTTDLDEPALRRVLETAAARASNDAVMTDLLTEVAGRHRIPETGALRAAFDAAASRLTSRAARESIRAL